LEHQAMILRKWGPTGVSGGRDVLGLDRTIITMLCPSANGAIDP
jgi:hypothetical protein